MGDDGVASDEGSTDSGSTMTTEAMSAGPVPPGGADDRTEIRLAAVMSGGVSLAVWMGGVTHEVYRLVTRDGPWGELADGLAVDPSVDVMVGTSAGGLNAALLAAAVSRDLPAAEFARIRRVWEEEGSLLRLLRSDTGGTGRTTSLLDGDGTFLPPVHDLLTEWLARPARDVPLTLLLTGTALSGEPWRASDDHGEAFAGTDHDVRFTFRSPELAATGGGPAARLARAARTTASFPIAFEASWCATGTDAPDDLAGVMTPPGSRYVIDGGVLANLPIGAALDAMFTREAATDVRRTVVLVNPAPSETTTRRAVTTRTPDPTATAVLSGVLESLSGSGASHQALMDLEAANETVDAQRRARDQLAALGADRLGSLAEAVWPTYRSLVARDLAERLVALGRRGGGEPPAGAATAAAAEDGVLRAVAPELAAFPLAFGATDVWVLGLRTLEAFVSTALSEIRRLAEQVDLSIEQRRAVSLVRESVHQVRTEIEDLRRVDNATWHAAEMPADEALDATGWAAAALSAVGRRTGTASAGAEAMAVARRVAGAIADLPTATTLPPRAPTPDSAVADLVGTTPGDTTRDDQVTEVLRRLAYLWITQCAVGGRRPDGREQPVTRLQVSLEAPVELPGPHWTRDAKITGLDLHHFGAFLADHWRANDWMWGRLDGARRLSLAACSPLAVRRRWPDVDAAAAGLRSLAVDDDTTLGAAWDDEATALRTELEALFAPGPLPTSLPRLAGAGARRLQRDIVREELPHLASVVRAADGGRRPTVAARATFTEAVATAGRPEGWTWQQAGDLLSTATAGSETLADVVASPREWERLRAGLVAVGLTAAADGGLVSLPTTGRPGRILGWLLGTSAWAARWWRRRTTAPR